MNFIKCEKLEKSMAELQFSIDAEAFKGAVADVFKKEGKKYAVPGFRKGKAPRAIIEKMYGADVFTYDAINELFPAAYEAAVKEAGVEPVGRPEVTVDSASETEGVTLTVKVAVKPEVKVGNYNGLTVEKTVHTVSDADVEAELKHVQERNARELTREGAAQNGDIADIDFEGFVDGVAFEGGKAEHYSLTLGSGSFIPGFEEQVVGHAAGEEFDVNVTFPEQYQAEELAGKPAVFKIKLHEVKYKELPALDDEFAKDVSEFDTLDALKDDIRTRFTKSRTEQNERAFESAAVQMAAANMTCSIPACMIDEQVDHQIEQFAYQLQSQGMKMEDYVKMVGGDLSSLRASMRPMAEQTVRSDILLSEIAHAENLEVTDEEVEEELKKLAEQYQMELDKVKAAVDTAAVKSDLMGRKAAKLITDSAVAVAPTEEKKEDDATSEKE